MLGEQRQRAQASSGGSACAGLRRGRGENRKGRRRGVSRSCVCTDGNGGCDCGYVGLVRLCSLRAGVVRGIGAPTNYSLLTCWNPACFCSGYGQLRARAGCRGRRRKREHAVCGRVLVVGERKGVRGGLYTRAAGGHTGQRAPHTLVRMLRMFTPWSGNERGRDSVYIFHVPAAEGRALPAGWRSVTRANHE